MAKLLVTGGAGFIGANFIHYWLEAHPEDTVVNLDALTYAGNLANLKTVEANPQYSFIKGDIRDAAMVAPLVADADVVVHFAAESHVDRSILGPEAFVETNIKGTFTLLEALRHAQGTSARKKSTRFHHISTDEVFGALALGDSQKFTEATPYNPHSPYAASKAASDHLVRAYHTTFGVPVTITNCSNNFGPYQHPEKFISRLITNLLDGEPAKVYGDGLYVRDWLHVRDHCRAIDAVLTKGTIGETYLVGGQPSPSLPPSLKLRRTSRQASMSEEINNLEVTKLILKYLQLGEDKIMFVKDRPGHDRRYAVDWSKINRELHWQPEHDFKEWLQQTIDWYRNNEAWWRPLKEEAEKIYK